MKVFWIFTEKLLWHIIFGRLHWYEVTLVKKCNKPLLQKRETNIFDQIVFWACHAFSHFLFYIPLEVLYSNWSKLKAVNNVWASYIKSRYVYVKFKRTNQSCLPSKISKSINVEMVNNSFNESKNNFGRLVKLGKF